MHVQGRANAFFATALKGLRSRSRDPGGWLKAVIGAVGVGLATLSELPRPRGRSLLVATATPLSATLGRGLRGQHRAQRVVKTWWASHTLEAVSWTLALALGIAAGLVVTRL